MTYLIKSPRLFSFHISAVDKIFHIFSGRETLRKNLFAVSERFDDDSIEFCERWERFVRENSNNFSFRPNVDELVCSIASIDRWLHHIVVERE